MLTFYLLPISYAFLTFPVAALLFTLPFLIVQYRRHGYINKIRALLLYLFLLYLMNALFLVILPLPASRHNSPPDAASYVQWIPLHFILDIMKETEVRLDQPSTYLHLLKERAFLQVIFNMFLTVPFGMFLRYYFRAGWSKCLVTTFLLSLFFEVTQVTGIYGFYDYPYRLFDVDDLLMNTAGGMISFVAAEWLSSVLPRIDLLDANVDLKQKRVSYTRRGIAFLLDWLLLLPVLLLLGALQLPAAYFLVTAVYFIAVPYITNGRTLGKGIVRIRIAGSGPRLRLREILVRSGLLYLLLGGLHALYVMAAVRALPEELLAVLAVVVFFADAWFALHLFVRLFNRSKKLFYEELSGTAHVIT